jgi:hypothetical protein
MRFELREMELILNTNGFEGYLEGLIQSQNPYYFPDGIDNNGSDFTLGTVLLKWGMGNFFKGQIGGLAVFNHALSPKELNKLAKQLVYLLPNPYYLLPNPFDLISHIMNILIHRNQRIKDPFRISLYFRQQTLQARLPNYIVNLNFFGISIF